MVRLKRALFLTLGILSISIGFIGVFLPVVPTVPLVLLAGYSFSRSSERFDRWLTEHPVFGPIILDWRAGVGFTARAKVAASVAIFGSVAMSIWLFVDYLWAKVIMAVVAISVVLYVITRPTKKAKTAEESAA